MDNSDLITAYTDAEPRIRKLARCGSGRGKLFKLEGIRFGRVIPVGCGVVNKGRIVRGCVTQRHQYSPGWAIIGRLIALDFTNSADDLRVHEAHVSEVR